MCYNIPVNINLNTKDLCLWWKCLNRKEVITITNVNSKGYGTIPKLVMQDKSLSPYAKAIYSYLKSYCGNKNECFASVDKICRDIHINRATFTKYINQLITLGYIKKRKNRKNGKFARNIYMICEFFNDDNINADVINDGVIGNDYINTNNNIINNNKKNKNTLYKREKKKSEYDDYTFEDFYEKP